MKKQILIVMALAVFSLTGTAFAESGMQFPGDRNGESFLNMEMMASQPDSVAKKDCAKGKKAKMKGEMGQMHDMQMKSGDSNQQAMMMQMMTMRKHMMQMMDNAKKVNGKGMMTKKQKDEMYAMMVQMMPKDKAQQAKMMKMNAKMVEMMKSGDMSKKNEMMSKMDPEMKAMMMKMMPKDAAQKAKMMETCTMMQQMMQRMKSKDKGMHKTN